MERGHYATLSAEGVAGEEDDGQVMPGRVELEAILQDYRTSANTKHDPHTHDRRSPAAGSPPRGEQSITAAWVASFVAAGAGPSSRITRVVAVLVAGAGVRACSAITSSSFLLPFALL